MAGGGIPIEVNALAGGYLTGRRLAYPLFLITLLFFLWGFSYGLLDVLNKHFQTVLGISKLQSTGLQVVYFGIGYLCFSPVAAEVLKRRGYKFTVLMGLSLYSTGAILFWPTAHFSSAANASASFGGFCACTAVIACGLSSLETAANSYAVVIGNPATASARLQFCQSFNGVASFIGPLIASKFFFSGANANNLVNVQFVYLAVSCAGVAVAVLFVISKLPEVSEEAIEGMQGEDKTASRRFSTVAGQDSIWKQYNMFFAFGAQFCYVGAQVTVASFFLNYATENAPYTSAEAANLLSYALITFTVSRFIATALATVLAPEFLMICYTVLVIVFNAYVVGGHGQSAVGLLIGMFFFEAPMYPTIFALGTANLGRHTRRGAGILVMGVGGGAVFPPLQGAVADAAGTRISYIIPLCGFIYVLGYVGFYWVRHGFQIRRLKVEEVVARSMSVADGVVVFDVPTENHGVQQVNSMEEAKGNSRVWAQQV